MTPPESRVQGRYWNECLNSLIKNIMLFLVSMGGIIWVIVYML